MNPTYKHSSRRKNKLISWFHWLILGLFFLTLVGRYFAGKSPEVVEAVYGRHLGPLIARGLSGLTGIFPFSVAEVLLVVHLIGGLVFVGLLGTWCFRRKWRQALGAVIHLICYLAVVYIIFMASWGFNYFRQPLASQLGLSVVPRDKALLLNLCQSLVEDANSQREGLLNDEFGALDYPETIAQMLSKSRETYNNFSVNAGKKANFYGAPKPVFMSKWMCYTQITGIYIPFTGEANVNIAAPDMLLPATCLHEIAHQRGVASEDEANYMAYVVAQGAEDPYFKYSGTLLGLIYSVNALYDVDPDAAQKLIAAYSPGVLGDLKRNREFWKPFEGEVSKAAEQVNDQYLKSNAQESGVASYGQMVDLLLAEKFKE